MKAITEFIKYELKPRLWDRYDAIFPELGFEFKANKWQSKKHCDGTDGTGKRPDRCVITKSNPYQIFDQKFGAKDVIKQFMDNNGIRETYEAVNKMCDRVGIEHPKYSDAEMARFERIARTVDLLSRSAKRQARALFEPGAEKELSYLRGRGFTDKEIKEIGFGYLSKSEAKMIEAATGEKIQAYMGESHTLSIPLKNCSEIYGFKVRSILPESERPYYAPKKYYYNKGVKNHIYNLSGVRKKDAELVTVEGEIDAALATVRGIKNVVATGGRGGMLSESLLNEAMALGVKKVTMLLDRDEAGTQHVGESIQAAHRNGITVFVAEFPEGETLEDGTPVHDVNEFLKKHDPHALQEIIDKARYATMWLYGKVGNEILKSYDGIATDKATHEIICEVIKLANQTPSIEEREILLKSCAEELRIGNQAFSVDALRVMADAGRVEADRAMQKTATEKAIQDAQKLLDAGETTKALEVMNNAAIAYGAMDRESRFRDLLILPTPQSREEEKRKLLEGGDRDIAMPYYFATEDGKQMEQLHLRSGAITFVCACTSHGKSTALQNMALMAATDTNRKGCFLYFTFEESKMAVQSQFVNKSINAQLSHNNMRSINTYEHSGKNRFAKDGLKTYITGRDAFCKNILDTGKLRIIEEDFDSTEMCEAIRYLSKILKVDGVFIDYIQLLSKAGCSLQRNEELKEICKDLKDLAVSLDLPIIMAAQLNRLASSPITMHPQNIAEAADIERIADKVILLWNSSFISRDREGGKSAENEWSKRTGITLGTAGKMYARLAKNRGGIVNTEAVFDFNGNQGTITQAKPTLKEYKAWEEADSEKGIRAERVLRKLLGDDLPF